MNIEQEFDACINRSKAGYREWYVGLAANPQERLFDGHNVSQKDGAWIHRDAGSGLMAKDIETIFLKKGCKGGPSQKDSPRHVYAYKMTRTTRGSKS